MTRKEFSRELLNIDLEREVEKITDQMKIILSQKLKRKGLVVAVSGGIDSSVCLALAAKAFGSNKVYSLLMPERHSSPDTLKLSTSVVEAFNVERNYDDISTVLEAVGFYKRYDDAIRIAIPEYDERWKSKIVISSSVEQKGINYFSVVAQSPNGEMIKKRLPPKAYFEVVAATNFKQRIRKMLEYYHADRLHYAVTGTPNRLEYDQGFFVKLGDGAADIKPIAHLYKTQVYQMAEYLGVPEEICKRQPTTDTYSMSQGQDEFYFSLPYHLMDLCLYGKNFDYSPEEVAPVVGLTPSQVKSVYDDIATKRSTTRYLHLDPQLVETVPEIAH